MHTSPLSPVLDTSFEMKTILFLLALGYVSSEKLNLAYLPPPGSQYSGGRPGDIQTPLEFPKETYSTTLRPQTGDNRGFRPEDYKATIGIDRIPPGVQDTNIGTPDSTPFTQNTQRVPTTTVSYAFTQTTTHPEGFETTIGPLLAGGVPNTDDFNSFSSQEPSFGGNLNTQNRPGYQQGVNQFVQTPTTGPAFNNFPSQELGLANNGNRNQPTLAPTGPVTQFIGSPVQSFAPGGQQFGQDRPQQRVPNQGQLGYEQSVSGNLPGVSPSAFEQNRFRNQSVPGNLGIGKLPGYVPSTVAPQGFPSTSQPISTTYGDNVNIPGSVTNIPQSGFPGQGAQPNQMTGQQQFVDGQRINQQFPGSQAPAQYGGLETRPSSSTAAPTFAPGFPNQQTPGISIVPNSEYSGEQYDVDTAGPQQYPGSQGSSVNRQNVFQPSSTAASTFPFGDSSQDFPSGTSGLPGQRDQQYPTSITPSSPTQTYPGAQANAASTVYRRPERPQAEADRNAVILNYENVITPEGFAYSFDTSNGIHADESGTAADGVKAKGSYSYIGDDGKLYSITYTADEDGFRPRGDHLPTPPPVPEAIQRVIDQVEKEKEAGISDDGSYNEDKYGHKKYQGAMTYRPQSANKVVSVGEDIPGDVSDVTLQKTKQRLRPQTIQGRPNASSGQSSQDSNEAMSEPGTNEQQRFEDNVDRRRPGQGSTQRPISHLTNTEEDNYGGDLEGIIENQPYNQRPTTRPFADVTSRRPVNQSVRKQYSDQNGRPEESTFRDGNRRRPSTPGRITVSEDQDSDQDTEYDRPKYTNKGTPRRPVNKLDRNQYDDEDIIDNYEGDTSLSRPSATGSVKRPVTNIETEDRRTESQQRFDKFGRPVNRISSKRPVSSKDTVENEPTYEESYNKKLDGSRRPSYKPSTYSPDESQTVTDDDRSEDDYVTIAPPMRRPSSGSKTSDKFASRDQYGSIGTRRRPNTSGIKVTDEVDQYQPEDNEEYIESNIEDHSLPHGDDDRRVNSDGKTSVISNDRYKDQEPEDFVPTEEQDALGRPKIPSSTKSDGTRRRPQISGKDDRIQQSGDERLNVPRPGSTFGQKITRPGFDQQTFSGKQYNNRPLNESGYQYIPPRRKFEEDRVKGIPTRFKGTTRRPFTGRPTPSADYEDEEVTGSTRPFMTPNVHQTDSEEFEDRDQTATPGQQQNQFDGKEYTESGTTPDQEYGDDEISSAGPVYKYPSVTRRPTSQQSSSRPQYYEQQGQNAGFEKERIPQKGRPAQSPENRYSEGTKRPHGLESSSTTPMPPTRPHISTSRPVRPGNQDQRYYTNEGPHRKVPGQGQTFVSSTTPLPSQSPVLDESYQQGTRRPQYQTTYRPMETIRPTAGYEDQTAQRYSTVRPTDSAISINPAVSKGQFQNNLPSTTYRPNYKITGQPSSTARPGAQVDRYGRPINKPGFGTTTQDFIPSGPIQSSSTIKPGVEIDMYGNPVYGTTVQDFIPGDQNEPSSSTAPEVLVDAFGVPIRPGSGAQDYTTGGPSSTAAPGFRRPINGPAFGNQYKEYVPGGQTQPSSTATPISVDGFGRPIQGPGFETIQQYIPGQIQPSSTARPVSSVDAYGRPTPTPGLTQDYTSGFSKPSNVQKIGDRVIGPYQQGVPSEQQVYHQGIPSIGDQGQQTTIPASPGTQFRGNQRYQPGFTTRPGSAQGVSSTFQPSTERIIGEDFSGPKQQQRFDPERGYYY